MVTFDRSELDFGQLVGRPVTLYSEQHPGQPLTARVGQTDGEYLALERTGGDRLLENLVNNQRVVVRFEYKQEPVCLAAVLKRRQGGRITVVMGSKVQPLVRRRFVRAPSREPINLAVLPAGRFERRKLPRLRWVQTELVDLSSGGALFDVNSYLQDSTYLFVNVTLDSYSFPPLVMGAVRHCHQRDPGHFHVGLEFIVAEQRSKHFGGPLLQDLPSSAFDYNNTERSDLNDHIEAWMQENKNNCDERFFK
jgi:hypothetical protein